MKRSRGDERSKRRAAERAASDVDDGDVVGLGTGSTAAYAITALGQAIDDGLSIVGVPTSYQSRELAIDEGIPITSLDAVNGIDIAIDGADQVVDSTAVKGGGGAQTREKAIAASADRFVVVIDETKIAERIDHTIPVEVIPECWRLVTDRLDDLTVTLRSASKKDGPVITDNGNFLLDVDAGTIEKPTEFSARLDAIPGVVDHGLFVDMIDTVYLGREDDIETIRW